MEDHHENEQWSKADSESLPSTGVGLTLATITQQIIFSLVSGLVFGSLLALTAIGLSLIFGVLEIPNFAQGEFAAFAGFLVISLMGFGLGLIISGIIAIVLTFLVGVILERYVFAKTYELERYFLISFFVSVGILIAFEELLRIIYGGGFFKITTPQLGSLVVFDFTISILQIFIVSVAIFLLLGLQLFTRYTQTGLAIRAVAEDKRGAEIVGINRERIYTITFGVGAGITGVTGVLYGMQFPLSPTMGVQFTAFAFVIVVLGGVGSFSGAILASLLIGIIDSLTVTFLGGSYRFFAIFLILFVILIIKPGGLWNPN